MDCVGRTARIGRPDPPPGEPIYVDQKADGEAMLAQLGAALTACQVLADEACGIGGNPKRITLPVRSTS